MRTDFAKEIIAIAHRVLEEKRSGREVDPLRLDWARSIISFNTHPSGLDSRCPRRGALLR